MTQEIRLLTVRKAISGMEGYQEGEPICLRVDRIEAFHPVGINHCSVHMQSREVWIICMPFQKLLDFLTEKRS